MDDLHQINAVIATAICSFFESRPDGQKIGMEEAKLLGKQIAQALNDVGLRITVDDQQTVR